MNFTKTILSGLKTWVEGKLSNYVPAVKGKGLSTEDYTTEEKEKLANLDSHIPQSDWNQNDSNATDYVKNRPFYIDKSENYCFFWSNIEQFSIENSGSSYGYSSVKLKDNIKLFHGETYNVNWDWIDYEVVAKKHDENLYYIGDTLFAESGEITGDVPFLIEFYNDTCNIYAFDVTTETETRHISIDGSIQEIIQIPKQFIPEPEGFLKENNPVGYGSFQMNPDPNNPEIGTNAAVFGRGSKALGDESFASGIGSKASGVASFASNQSKAIGWFSHAEGVSSAEGSFSHAEGGYTNAHGLYSHAEGYYTSAMDYQHVQGRYNLIDELEQHAHIVGNGKDEANRSNAHTLDWNGNAWFAGEVYVGGIGQDDDTAKKLLTEDKLNEFLLNNTATDEETIAMLVELDVLTSTVDETGSLPVDNNGSIVI